MRRVIAALIALFVLAAAPAQAANGGASAGSGGTGTTAGSGSGTPSHHTSGGTPPTSPGGTPVAPDGAPSAGSGPAPERTPEPRPPSGNRQSQAPTGSFARGDIPPLYLKHYRLAGRRYGVDWRLLA